MQAFRKSNGLLDVYPLQDGNLLTVGFSWDDEHEGWPDPRDSVYRPFSVRMVNPAGALVLPSQPGPFTSGFQFWAIEEGLTVRYSCGRPLELGTSKWIGGDGYLNSKENPSLDVVIDPLSSFIDLRRLRHVTDNPIHSDAATVYSHELLDVPSSACSVLFATATSKAYVAVAQTPTRMRVTVVPRDAVDRPAWTWCLDDKAGRRLDAVPCRDGMLLGAWWDDYAILVTDEGSLKAVRKPLGHQLFGLSASGLSVTKATHFTHFRERSLLWIGETPIQIGSEKDIVRQARVSADGLSVAVCTGVRAVRLDLE